MLALVVLFIALTRTKVGRDGLRVQLETQFNETFVGDIQIGRLQGNLLNTLYAYNIKFTDSLGAPVATIDAAVLEPSWLELLRKTISMRRLTLIKPDFYLEEQPDQAWNFQDLFRRKDGRPPQLFFNSSDIRVIGGTAVVQNAPDTTAANSSLSNGAPVSTRIDALQARINLELRSDVRLVDIQQASFAMPQNDLNVRDLHGQLLIESGRIELNELYFESSGTQLTVSASIENPDSLRTSPEAAVVDLDLQDSILDRDVVHLFFPEAPLAEKIYVSARIQGRLDDLDVETLQVSHGALVVDATGNYMHSPDSLFFTFDLANSVFSRRDLENLIPTLSLAPIADTHPVSIHTLNGRAAVYPASSPLAGNTPVFGKINLGVSSPGGAINGTVELSRHESDSLTLLQSFLRLDSLDVSAYTPRVRTPSRLNGIVAVTGSGPSLESIDADVQVNLGDLFIDTHPIDTLDLFVTTNRRSIELSATASQRDYGRLDLIADYQRSDEAPVKATLRLTDVDLGRFDRTDSLRTALNGTIQLATVGAAPETLRGEIRAALDSSSVMYGPSERILPPHNTLIALADVDGDQQRLQLSGDAARVSMQGRLDPAMVIPLGKLWAESLTHTLKKTIQKTRPASVRPAAQWLDRDPLLDETISSLYIEQLAGRVEEAMTENGIGRHTLDLRFALLRPDLISPWIKGLPPLSTNLSGAMKVTSTPDRLDLDAHLEADSLSSDSFLLTRLTGDFRLEADRTKPVADQLSIDTWFQADSLHFIGQVFPQPTFSLELADHRGSFSLLTKSTRRVGTQRLRSSFELLPERNRFYIEDLLVSVGNSFWSINESAYLDVYGQSLVIPGLSVQSRSPEANILQLVNISGVLSPTPGDTASIAIDNIAMRPISQFLNMKVPIGGLLNGQLAFTTANKQPELTGAIFLDRFTLDNRILGDVSISSTYIPGEQDVGLRVEVTPIASYNQTEFLPDAALPAVYKENSLTLDGTFRLPRFNQSATGFLDAGALDLALDMQRADLFFFEYIFPGVLDQATGYLTGQGNITGDITYPLFDIDLNLVDGEVYIPKFNLRYTNFEGPLHINDTGIELRDATFEDPTGGQATISGGILFNDYRFFSFDLEASVDEILIMNQYTAEDLPFYGQIWGSGTLELTGPTHSAQLFSQDAFTKASSELFIPITEEDLTFDEGFLIFADSAGNVPDFEQLTYRRNLLSRRPEGERKFVDGLDMDLNITVPSGSTIHLVFDPLLGDVINAVSSGRVQLQKREGEFSMFGTLSVESGDYLFTAGDVFARRFLIESGGSITWDGNPIDARLNIPAAYRTRASTAGLPDSPFDNTLIPLIVSLDITGRVTSPQVVLGLETDRSDRNQRGNYEGIEAYLNQSERTTDYATSVLLTNSFLLTTESNPNTGELTSSGEQIAFSSVSQLVSSQLNRFLNEAIPNADFNLGLQGESLEDPDVTYGVALYLLNERLVIRGQGVYQNDLTPNQPGLEGEFEVEVRLSSNVSVSVFLRREGDVLAENALTRARGAGLSYQTQFTSWGRFFNRLFGWIGKKNSDPPTEPPVAESTDNE